jgi:Kdo2-lipid IVA lauroyltransferase/acyltransferase
VSWFYRAASNRAGDRLIQELRREATGGEVPMFAKGASGARAAFISGMVACSGCWWIRS